MRINNRKWNIWGRKIIALLLLCGLLLPVLPQSNAASITYEYKWIEHTSDLPTDNQWHDYFLAWEDTDDEDKVWFTNYHWYTADGDNSYDAGGTHWMEYKAPTTLPDSKSKTFTSSDSLGHMEIKYAGVDEDNDAPMYYIRVSKMHGGYMYFTSYEPSSNPNSADEFTFQDKGDVFHIFVNASGKADRYLTRNGQYLETTESSSYGGGEYYRPLRVYQRTPIFNEDGNSTAKDAIGKVKLYEYFWVNTVDELLAIANTKQWTDVMIAWEDADGYGTTNPDKVWYTKEVWYNSEGSPNYRNGAGNEFYYYSSDYLGSDGYGSPYAESFILPSQASHFQIKCVDWDGDNPVHGYTTAEGKNQKSPVVNIRFDIGRGRYIYVGNNGFYDDADDAEDYTLQMRLGKKDAEDLYGSVWIINNISWGEDEMITRKNNRFDVSNWTTSGYWEFPFRIYSYRKVEYDAIVKSFTIGKGATYSIDRQLIVDNGVTITVEDGGVLMVDDHLLNNGNIVVKNGGTVIINEGGYIMAYDQKAECEITLDGGDLIIMDNAKMICDGDNGIVQASHGATILNRGMLMVGGTLALNDNSLLKNEDSALLLVGGRINQERGGIGAFAFGEVADRVKSGYFTYVCAKGSKIINKGTISQPLDTMITRSAETKTNTKNEGYGSVVTRNR